MHRPRINISGLSRAPVSNASPAPGRAPARADRHASRSVARDFAARARIPRSSPAGRMNGRKECWVVMTLATSSTASGSGGSRIFDAFPVAPALAVAFLLARRLLPVALLRLPPLPLPRSLPALLAAITLVRLPGMKALLASSQQTTPLPRPTWQSPPPSLLISGIGCSTLGRAHGR